MARITKISLIIILLGAATGTFWYWKKNPSQPPPKVLPSGATSEAVAEISKYQYTESFTHPTLGFSFKYPKDFRVSSVPADSGGGEAILVQNGAKSIGVQILVTPTGESDTDLVEADIKEQIPDITITDPQEVLVGSGRKGLAFLSDNEAFAGKSREVWFVFRGNLYQISTYAEQDGFLKGIFQTWKFQ